MTAEWVLLPAFAAVATAGVLRIWRGPEPVQAWGEGSTERLVRRLQSHGLAVVTLDRGQLTEICAVAAHRSARVRLIRHVPLTVVGPDNVALHAGDTEHEVCAQVLAAVSR